MFQYHQYIFIGLLPFMTIKNIIMLANTSNYNLTQIKKPENWLRIKSILISQSEEYDYIKSRIEYPLSKLHIVISEQLDINNNYIRLLNNTEHLILSFNDVHFTIDDQLCQIMRDIHRIIDLQSTKIKKLTVLDIPNYEISKLHNFIQSMSMIVEELYLYAMEQHDTSEYNRSIGLKYCSNMHTLTANYPNIHIQAMPKLSKLILVNDSMFDIDDCPQLKHIECDNMNPIIKKINGCNNIHSLGIKLESDYYFNRIINDENHINKVINRYENNIREFAVEIPPDAYTTFFKALISKNLNSIIEYRFVNLKKLIITTQINRDTIIPICSSLIPANGLINVEIIGKLYGMDCYLETRIEIVNKLESMLYKRTKSFRLIGF